MPGMWRGASQRERERDQHQQRPWGRRAQGEAKGAAWLGQGRPPRARGRHAGPGLLPQHSASLRPPWQPCCIALFLLQSQPLRSGNFGSILFATEPQHPEHRCPAPYRGSALATPARCERSAGGKMSVAVLGLSCEGPGALPQGWPGWEGAGGLVRVSPGCEVPGSHCLQTLKFSYAVVFFSE